MNEYAVVYREYMSNNSKLEEIIADTADEAIQTFSGNNKGKGYKIIGALEIGRYLDGRE